MMVLKAGDILFEIMAELDKRDVPQLTVAQRHVVELVVNRQRVQLNQRMAKILKARDEIARDLEEL